MDAPNTEHSFGRRLLALMGVLGPLGYVGTLAAVAVHEVLGHGLAAILLGGRLHGFVIHWDGMGWASTSLPEGAPSSHLALKLAAGAVATTFFGGLFLGLAFWRRRDVFLPVALALLSAVFVLDGSIYMFWSAYFPEPPGDFARIILLTGSAGWRWTFMLVGLFLTATFTLLPLALLVRGSSRWLFDGEPVRGWRRAILPGMITAGFALGQIAFDWNQLIRGIGRLPQVAGALAALPVGLALWRVPLPPIDQPLPLRAALRPLLATGAAALAMILLMLLWLTGGAAA
jgi:peptidase M50B-like protein